MMHGPINIRFKFIKSGKLCTYLLQHRLKIFKSNIKSLLLQGSETWTVTKRITSDLQAFIARCPRKI